MAAKKRRGKSRSKGRNDAKSNAVAADAMPKTPLRKSSPTVAKRTPSLSKKVERPNEKSSSSDDEQLENEIDATNSDDDDGEEEPIDTPKNLAPKASSGNDDRKNGDDDDESNSSQGSDDNNGDDEDGMEDEGQIKQRKSSNKPNAKVFSDENATWLKPTKKSSQLLSSDDEDEDEVLDDEIMAASNDENSDQDEELEIERQSRMLDAEKQVEDEEAEDEMQEMVTKHSSVYHLPTGEELEKDVDRVIPPSEIRSHVNSILEVLADFSKRREPGRARTEYVERLGSFMAELFGYLPELVEYFLTMFSPNEALEFIEYSDKPRPMVVRTNTLKTRRKDLAMALMKRGVSLDPLANWSKVGLKIIESPVPIGATPEYLSGHYMLQSAASMCPVMALAPEPKERVLDMSSAPGGKTSYIAQLMRNTGVIFANDLRPDRQRATVANMHRLGVKNVIACTYDGRKLAQLFKQYRFDRILLDAPCSGLGVISRDPSVKVQRTLADVNKCAHLQKELLLAAIDILSYKSKTGGVMVYSTCSVSIAENEEVINYALQKRDIKLIDTELDFGKPGFTRYQQKRYHPSLALTRRFYPHVHNMDGFFVAKIKKLSDKHPGEAKPDEVEDAGILGEATNAAADDKEAIEDNDDISDDEPKTKTPSKKATKGKKGKKRKGDDASLKKKKAKVSHVSVPPQAQTNEKSKKTNAKVTKPRRRKPDAVA